MTTFIHNLSRRQLALIIGITLLIMVVTSGAAFGGIHPSLFVVSSDTILSQLTDSINMLYLEIFLWAMVVITDNIVTWTLHLYLREVNPTWSRITAGLRLVYTAILAYSITHLIQIASLVNSASAKASAIISLEQQFMTVWAFGLILFGLHLLALAYLSWLSSDIPKIIAILLFIGGLSYSLVHTLMIMGPQFADVTATLESVLTIPMALAELSLALWMIIRGGTSMAESQAPTKRRLWLNVF